MAMILWILYFIGIPVTFYTIGGVEDLKPTEEEDEVDETDRSRYHEPGDRLLAVAIAFCISLCWPFFWGMCLVISLITRLFGGLS